MTKNKMCVGSFLLSAANIICNYAKTLISTKLGHPVTKPPIYIDHDILVSLAGQGAYDRGLAYFKQNHVLYFREENNIVKGVVSGNENYNVTVDASGDSLKGVCNCPASRHIVFCKHCVAVVMEYAHSQIQNNNCNNHIESIDMTSKQICLVRRRSDGRYLRGSKFFTWVSNFRRASMVSPDMIRQYHNSGALKSRYNIESLEEIELILEPIRSV
jgi:hypothetical protein